MAINNEPLNYLALRNKERYEQWKERLKEYRETHHGKWVEWEHGDKYDEPTFLREISAI
jgi:hypothetical protein